MVRCNIDDGHEDAVFLGTMIEIELGAMVETAAWP